jgi:hypothetical protein
MRAAQDPKGVEETLAFYRKLDERVTQARDQLEADRAAFAQEKDGWYRQSAAAQSEHQQRMAAELTAHREKIASEKSEHETQETQMPAWRDPRGQ